MGPLDFIGNIADTAKGIVDKFVPDQDTKLKLQAELDSAKLNAAVELAKAQAAIELSDSQAKDKFQSRARPFIMWVCGLAFATQYVLGPLVHQFYVIPTLDMSVMMPVLLGILGLGAARTVEKIKDKD